MGRQDAEIARKAVFAHPEQFFNRACKVDVKKIVGRFMVSYLTAYRIKYQAEQQLPRNEDGILQGVPEDPVPVKEKEIVAVS